MMIEELLDGTTKGKVAATLIVIAMVPVNAVVHSWALTKLWGWFLSPQYGAGPSYAGWYGISLLVGMLFLARLSHLSHKDGWDKPSAFVGRALELPLVSLMILAATYVVGSLLGWIA